IEDGALRFPHERQPGLALTLPLDVDLARLLGYYCAEGCVVTSKTRPNSHTLNFSFSHGEANLDEEVRQVLKRCLGLNASRINRSTTIGVAVGKASVTLLFK